MRHFQTGGMNLATNDYQFVTHWRVESTIEEVSKVLADPLELVRWWPSVYLDVKVLEPGNEQGLGKVASLYTKGWLPYTLGWNFRVTGATWMDVGSGLSSRMAHGYISSTTGRSKLRSRCFATSLSS